MRRCRVAVYMVSGGGVGPPAGDRHPACAAGRRLLVPLHGHGPCSAQRVLPWIACGWLMGLFVGAHGRTEAGPMLVGAAVLAALPLLQHGRELSATLWQPWLGLAAFACGLGVAQPANVPCVVRGDVEGLAAVDAVQHGVADARLRLKLLEARLSGSSARAPSGQALRARVTVERAPPVGSTIRFRAELRPRTELRNPTPRALLSTRRRACWAHFGPEDSFEVASVPDVVSRIERARARVRAHMRRALPEDAAAVARALVLGDGGALGHERRQAIAAVGLAHLFAVSGLHVALVSGTLVAALRWLLGGWAAGVDLRRVAWGLGAPLTLLHAAFAGGSPSAWRAAITAATSWTLLALGRRPSPGRVTAAAALVLSAPDPSMALRPAFLLSIVATAAILSGPTTGARSWRARVRHAATISARTLVATAPMVWWWFGGVPLIGWVTNLVVLPFGSMVVIPLAHVFAASTWVPSLAEPLGRVLALSCRALLAVCDAFGPLAVARRLPPLDLAQGLVVAVGCGLLLGLRGVRRRVLVLLVCGALWLGAEYALVAREQPRGVLRVTFVDVGQGDAALIDLPDGRLAMVDTGQGGRHPAVRELRGLLAARRRARIDLLVITHGHPDHFGGLEPLLDAVPIEEIWVNGQRLVEERDGAMERLLSTAMAHGTKLRFAPELCENTVEFGSAHFEVVWPCPRYDPALGLNDNSLSLRLTYGRRAFLLTGDLEAEAERRLLREGRVRPADVLKVSHHGSRTSTSRAFLEAARPALAVISSGAGNRYGHPSPVVLERLREAGAVVHRTDLGGGAVIATDGDSLEIRR